jgi:hypothetical protein
MFRLAGERALTVRARVARAGPRIASMGILANVMPGVRAIRAPLAAGLLLLLSAWVAFQSQIPEHPRDGVWAGLERLDGVLSAIGTVVLIGFGAYVGGSLYLVAVPPLGRAAASLAGRLGGTRAGKRLVRLSDHARGRRPPCTRSTTGSPSPGPAGWAHARPATTAGWLH